MISSANAHPTLPHFSADGCEDKMLIWQFHSEHRPRQDDRYYSFYFNRLLFFVTHSAFL